MDQTDRAVSNLNQISVVGDENLKNRGAQIRNTEKSLNRSIGSKDDVLFNQSNSNSPNSSSTNPVPSRRPKNTALKQQRLPAWQPVLTAKTVLPLFFSVGILFVALGAVLLVFSNMVDEYVNDYTLCESVEQPGKQCSSVIEGNISLNCTCEIKFKLEKEFKKPVYLYYGLQNFYQNHRRYVKSRDDSQLLGRDVSTLNTECAPYDKDQNGNKYAPCGAIANSLFNDSFSLTFNNLYNVALNGTGIAWDSDKSTKFRNPSSWANTTKPKNWRIPVQDLGDTDSNRGYKNEDLIVWMRTAALPTFRKFYRRVEHSDQFSTGLPAGNYTVRVNYNYPVTSFDGRKTFVISTTTWIGGKNPFLGIAYLVVGIICICLGFLFLAVHLKFSRNPKAPEDLNNRTNVTIVETPERT